MAPGALAGLVLLLGLVPLRPAGAEPITVVAGSANNFRSNVAPNDVGITDGDRNQLGARVDPSAGTTMTASQGSVTFTVSCQPLAVDPLLCATATLFSPSRMGAWQLTFRNGPDAATATTPALAGAEEPAPLPTSVVASGSSLTPTFTFEVPAGFTPDGIRINIWDRAVTLPTGLRDVVHSQAVPASTRSFTVPVTLSSGQSLRVNNPYTLEVSLIETRGHVDFSSNDQALILRRSRAFFDFVPVEDAAGGVTLPPSLPPPNFTPAFFESQLESLNERFVAQGGEPLAAADCPGGLCAGPVAQQTPESYLFDLFYAEPRLRDVRAEADTLLFRTHLPTCPAGTPYTPEQPCFDLGEFQRVQGRLGQAQGQVTDAAVRRVSADAAAGARLTAATILQRPEQAVREAVRGLFVSRVFGLAAGDLTDAVKAQVSALARLPAPAVVLLPATATITYSPTSTTQTGQVVGIRGVETSLGTFATVGFAAQVQLDEGLLDFLRLEVGRRTQAFFGVLGTGFALMEAEVSGLLPERQVELTFRGVSPAGFAQTERASVQLSVSGSAFRAGDTLTVSLDARNPLGNVEADLYVGALLPDGRTAVFFTAPGAVGAPVSLGRPSEFPRMQAAPLGLEMASASLVTFRFPTAGLAPGTYQLFAALVRPGALADDRVDPDDVLALDVKPVSFTP